MKDLIQGTEWRVIESGAQLKTKEHIRQYAMHGKTMLMMYEATKEERYLKQARLDYHRAKSLQECGFVRPLGCYLAA